MMYSYAEAWSPRSFEEAEFQIDAGNEGDAFWRWGADRAAELRAYAPSHANVVLDYGCGVGRVLRNVDAPVRIGVDVSAQMVEMAKGYAPECAFIQGDGRSIPVADQSVDFIYSLLTIQHMDAPDVIALMAEIKRALRPEGTCYLEFSGFGAPWSPTATLSRAPCDWKGQRAGSEHSAAQALAYGPEIIQQLCCEAGLTQLGIEGAGIGAAHPRFKLWAIA